MTTKQEIKSLTWKYFWKQKATEVSVFLLIAMSIIFLPYLVGHSIGNNANCYIYYGNSTGDYRMMEKNQPFEETTIEECTSNGGEMVSFHPIGQWFEGVVYIFMTLAVIAFLCIILLLVGSIIYDWLSDNWDKANKRATKELRNIKTRSRK